jgi:hypothetical protein
MRVLEEIARHPGSSNRSVGAYAEIHDQGQISKLLGRLERGGLIRNSAPGPGQGLPNAWELSDRGRWLAESIHAHKGGGRVANG